MAHTTTIRFAVCTSLVLVTTQLQAQYDSNASEPIPRLGGTLILGGGGELPGQVYDGFRQLAGGDGAKVLLLTSPQTPARAMTNWRQRVSEHLDWTTAQQPQGLALLGNATGVWILGGDPKALADALVGTAVERALQSLLARGGVIGCNGDLVRAMSKVMIRQGQPHAEVGRGLDLVPGAVLDNRFTRAQRRNRLLGVLAARPDLVGLGIDAETAMVLHQRFIDVVGTGSVHGCVIGSQRRLLRIDRINRRLSPTSQRRQSSPRGDSQTRRRKQRNRNPRGQRLRPRRLADLIALSRAAQARVAKSFPAFDPRAPRLDRGTLIIVGGGGMPKGLMDRFIELAGGKSAPLLFVPCDERRSIPGEPRMLQVWRRAGATDVDWIHTKDRREANGDATLLAKIRRAKGIWFGGGRQWNFVDSYQNTTAHRLMHEVLASGGVIGGSSAGASIQGSYLARANPLGNRDAMAEGYEIGLGFLTGVAIDQHFSQRGRLPDMTALVNRYPQLLGIGLDEASSIIVQGSVATAFSRVGRKVHLYDRRVPVMAGQPDYLVLTHGQRFDLVARKRMTNSLAKPPIR